MIALARCLFGRLRGIRPLYRRGHKQATAGWPAHWHHFRRDPAAAVLAHLRTSTQAGKKRAKLNAVKHGTRAATLVLLDEGAEALDDRKAAWTARLGSVAIMRYTGMLKVCWTLVRASAAGTWTMFPGPSGDNSEVL